MLHRSLGTLRARSAIDLCRRHTFWRSRDHEVGWSAAGQSAIWCRALIMAASSPRFLISNPKRFEYMQRKHRLSTRRNGLGKMPMNAPTAKKFLWFQAINLLVSLPVFLFLPSSVLRKAIIYVLFSAKVIALIYWNDFPAKKDPYSLAFFVIACIEVILLFLTGSFSIYTFLFSRL